MIHLAALIQRFLRRSMRPVQRAIPLDTAPPIYKLPSTHQEAAHKLAAHSVVNSAPYRERFMRHSREGSHPDLIRFQVAFCKELQRRGIPMFPICFVRGKTEQDNHYKNGVSKAKWGQSPHNYGLAVDVVHFGRYWDLSVKEWQVIGLIGKEVARRCNLKMTWGGDWKFYDPAHWEITRWEEMKDWGQS